MISTYLLVVLLSVSVTQCQPPSSQTIYVVPKEHKNGTVGHSWTWRCHPNISPRLNDTSIYWQGSYKNPDLVVHAYVKGKEDLQHQSKRFNNRTKVFPEQLASGNLSLVIEPLKLEDDQTELVVVVWFGHKTKESFCQTMLHVAAKFQDPHIEINQRNLTATCSTTGGYPKPELRWSSGDGGPGLDIPEQETTTSLEGDGTFSIRSTANISGLQEVTCSVYNPTSTQTLTATKETHIPAPPTRWHVGLLIFLGVLAVVAVVAVAVVLYLRYRRDRGPQATDEGNAVYRSSSQKNEENAACNESAALQGAEHGKKQKWI